MRSSHPTTASPNTCLCSRDESNDRLWRLPLADEYRSSLDSPIADIAHVSRGNVGGGAITAALFLKEFTGSRRWAHLDIAGPARADKPRDELSRVQLALVFGCS